MQPHTDNRLQSSCDTGRKDRSCDIASIIYLTMHARGKTFRRISLTKRSHDRNNNTPQFPLPFPIASISTILLVLILLSTLSALYIGAHRNHHATVIDLSSVVVTSSDAIVVDNKNINHNDGSSSASGNNNNNNESNNESNENKHNNDNNNGPTIRSFQDLSPSELHPQAGPDRHIVSPPADEIPVTLVTCSTTVGYLHILVHPSWAPLGAQRFLQMVNSKYFSTKVVRSV